MLNKIAIVLKNNLKNEKEIIGKLNSLIDKNKTKTFFVNDINKDELVGADLVITVGGDGTFVRTANLVEDSSILGINAEPEKSEGALIGITINELEKLRSVLSGGFDVSIYQRIKVTLNGKILPENALNEIYIGAVSQFYSSRYIIKFKGMLEEQRSSGLIISTGTGSPAWFYSAGGKIFKPEEKKLSFVVREPYFGKRVFVPTILNGDIRPGKKLIIESTRDFGGILAINEAVYSFNRGDTAEITLSDKPLRVIRPTIK